MFMSTLLIFLSASLCGKLEIRMAGKPAELSRMTLAAAALLNQQLISHFLRLRHNSWAFCPATVFVLNAPALAACLWKILVTSSHDILLFPGISYPGSFSRCQWSKSLRYRLACFT